jgi:glutamine synthetase
MFATSAAVKAIARREISLSAPVSVRAMANLAAYEDFGKNVFTGKVADEYLKKHGASLELLKDPAWVKNSPDVVADAVFDWYVHRQDDMTL